MFACNRYRVYVIIREKERERERERVTIFQASCWFVYVAELGPAFCCHATLHQLGVNS